MALGVPPRTIALRPLLVGASRGSGRLVRCGRRVAHRFVDGRSLRSFQPLPHWWTEFQPGGFAGAMLGLLLPIIATVLPVWRAVRVPPVDAISTTHRAGASGLAPLLRRIPLPGSSVAELPIRNVLREPRRTLLTAFGIAAAITTLVGVVGVIDSFLATIDRATRRSSGRVRTVSRCQSTSSPDGDERCRPCSMPVGAEAESHGRWSASRPGRITRSRCCCPRSTSRATCGDLPRSPAAYVRTSRDW